MFRQGDVLIIPVKKAKKGTVIADSSKGRVVLAHGEATGHAHAIYEHGAVLTETEDERFLKIMAGGGVDLKHEEHGAIHLAPGNYKVVRQREYSMEDVRFVRD